MNARSLLLGHTFERADFQDTEGATRPMFWVTDYPIPEESQLMMLHRIVGVGVPADRLHAMNDADMEDELSYGVFKETLVYALGAVAAIFGSVIQPWQWF